jgi:hypothetical protein
MLNGVFVNDDSAAAIIKVGRRVQAMSRQGVAVLKAKLYEVIDEYIRVNRKTDRRLIKAHQLRQELNLSIADNVATIFLRMHALILMDQVSRNLLTSYSKNSLYVMVHELLNRLNVFNLEHPAETPAAKVEQMLNLCIEMGRYAEQCEKLATILQAAKHDYQYWFSQKGPSFAYRNISHGHNGQVNAEIFTQHIRSFIATINLVEMLKLLQKRLQEGRFNKHSFNIYIVKHLYLGDINGEFMHTQQHECNKELAKNVFVWLELILSTLTAARISRQAERRV